MKYKIIDSSNDSYIKVFDAKLEENIVIHPAVRDKSEIEGDYIITPDDNRYVKENIHAIRCGCSGCTGLKAQIVQHIKDTNAPVVIIDKGDK